MTYNITITIITINIYYSVYKVDYRERTSPKRVGMLIRKKKNHKISIRNICKAFRFAVESLNKE